MNIKGNIVPWIAILILIGIIFFMRHEPDYKPEKRPDIAKIVSHEQDRDSIKKEVAKTEENQKDVKKTYRKAVETLGSGNTPCRDTVLQIVQLCDTVIFVDSVLIVQLKQVIKEDSIIIGEQKKVIRADSLTISDLTKSVKKEKRKSWWKGFKAGFVAGNITGGAAGIAVAR